MTRVSMNTYPPISEPAMNVPLVEKWITDSRPLPRMQLLAEELILEIAYRCLDPASLLSLSSTCKVFARILRVSGVWLLHHRDRGFDTEVLEKKALGAASVKDPEYGQDGWGVLVKSAFDKAEFPDDSHETQWNMGKPLPHLATQREFDPDAIEKYQARGERWMRVFYNILTEHRHQNLRLYPFLHDEALQIRVKSRQGRYFQALICASDLLSRMWISDNAVMNTRMSYLLSASSIEQLRPHNERHTSLSSLTKTFLIAKKIMEVDPDNLISQTQRRLYPHPPFGSEIWEHDGVIDPDGLGWIRRVMDDWGGRVYVVGQYTVLHPNWHCPYNKFSMGRGGVFRMCLDFHPDSSITGRGGDEGGRFWIISGSYRKTFVEFTKQYEDDEDPDAYTAQGHMTPWGVYGTWARPQEPEKVLGYWVMWRFEGAPQLNIRRIFEDPKTGRVSYPRPWQYKAEPGWFEEYEKLRDAGKFKERYHTIDDNIEAKDVPLPEVDAFGL